MVHRIEIRSSAVDVAEINWKKAEVIMRTPHKIIFFSGVRNGYIKKFHQAIIVFDGYSVGPSTRDTAHFPVVL